MFKLFKKRKNILAVLLTSADVKRARRTYKYGNNCKFPKCESFQRNKR
jgi:hypothetical protein